MQRCSVPPLAKDCSYVDRTTTNTTINHSIVKAETQIVGHIPREMSRTFWYFIRHGVGWEVTGRKMFGKGLKSHGGAYNEKGGRGNHNTNFFDVKKLGGGGR